MSKLRKIFASFWKQTTTLTQAKTKFVGEDHLGNKYFEAYRPNSERQQHRYFEKPNVNSFESIVDAAHVPPCWDAWLRFRRHQPPTKQEVDESEEYYQMQQKRAKEKKLKDIDERASKQESPSSSATFGDKTNERGRTLPPGYHDRLH